MPLPLVLITGQLLTDAVWAPLLDALPPRDVTFADHRSDDSIAGIAQRLLDTAPPRFDLAAHAMGGFVAFEVLRRAPERVARLVLIATLAAADGPAQTARRQGYLDLVEQGRFMQVVEERIPMLFPPDRRDDGALLSLARTMAAATGADTFLRQQRAIMSRADSRASLAGIASPTLLVWGDADGITTRVQQDEMLAAIADVRLAVIAGAGHLPMLERPEETALAVGGFLQG